MEANSPRTSGDAGTMQCAILVGATPATEPVAHIVPAMAASGSYRAACAASVASQNGQGLPACALCPPARGHAALWVQADQTHAPAWQAWGRFEADQGDARAARRLFNTSLQHQPHHEPTLNALAKLEMASSNWAAAQALLRRAIESNPTHAQSWTALGEVCYRLGDLDQARQMFECLARYCGPDSIAYTTWANVELHAGELGALPCLSATGTFPGSVTAWIDTCLENMVREDHAGLRAPGTGAWVWQYRRRHL